MKWMQVQPMEGSQAQLTAYIHERELGRGECVKRPAVLIFPGGGYNSISTREMEPGGRWHFLQEVIRHLY